MQLELNWPRNEWELSENDDEIVQIATLEVKRTPIRIQQETK